jgi:CRP/FNR family cyclic AMP-dependent transcriptional regulator
MPTSRATTVDLTSHAAFSGNLRLLAERGEPKRYAKGVILIQEGDQGDMIYIIVEGRLRAYTSSADDEREFHYGTYGPGEYVGEMGLDGGRRSANVITLEPSLCVKVGRPTLERFIADHPGFAFELLGKVIGRARSATQQAQMLALENVYGRLRWLLESQAVLRPDGVRVVERRLTHLEIASRLGCSREMVSRVMKEVERRGLVHETARGLVLNSELPRDL